MMFSPRKKTAEGAPLSPQQVRKTTPSRSTKSPTSKPSTPGSNDAFITSSPRKTKAPKEKHDKHAADKHSGAKLQRGQSASKNMFSPPYQKSVFNCLKRSKDVSPEKYADSSMEISPVKLRLQQQLALHGHKEQQFDEYDEEEFDPWRFIASLPAVPPRRSNKCCLPRKNCNKMTLVLDLDETLVHCSTDPNDIRNPQFVFEVEFNNTIYKVSAKKRPGFDEFLEHVRDKFEVVVFTASQRVYADKLLDILDPGRRCIQHRVFRDDCVVVEGNYLKDLNVLGRDLRRTCIVDNSPQAFSFQLDNGLPILSWFDSDDDTELYKIIPVIDQLAASEDVRPILRERFQLYRKVEAKSQEFGLFHHQTWM